MKKLVSFLLMKSHSISYCPKKGSNMFGQVAKASSYVSEDTKEHSMHHECTITKSPTIRNATTHVYKQVRQKERKQTEVAHRLKET